MGCYIIIWGPPNVKAMYQMFLGMEENEYIGKKLQVEEFLNGNKFIKIEFTHFIPHYPTERFISTKSST